jgi:hypothetical protein
MSILGNIEEIRLRPSGISSVMKKRLLLRCVGIIILPDYLITYS